MINNIQFKIIAGKINKIPEFYTIFARKMADYIIRQQDQGQADAKSLRPRPKFWQDLTSLDLCQKHMQVWNRSLGDCQNGFILSMILTMCVCMCVTGS